MINLNIFTWIQIITIVISLLKPETNIMIKYIIIGRLWQLNCFLFIKVYIIYKKMTSNYNSTGILFWKYLRTCSIINYFI